MSIETHIEEIRTAIKAGHFINEASVSQGIVLRLLQALAWSIYDPQVVCPEYKLQGRRVDYALCHPASKPIAFIEVKQIGQSEGAEKQLFEYAFHVGIPLAILTDGREWNFFLPAEQGSYDERRVYKLDIMQRDLSECAARLTRYLHYDAVASGEAIKAAREDYRNVSRERQIEVTLPQAWTRLIAEEDEALLELVAERVESLCGFKPDLKTVAGFLKGNNSVEYRFTSTQQTIVIPQSSANQVIDTSVKTNSIPLSIGFTLDGQHYSSQNIREMIISIFEILIQRDSTFAKRFVDLPTNGRNNRRFLAKTKEELNRGEQLSVKLKSDWWICASSNKERIQRMTKMACKVANLQYGKDITINLG